LLPGLYALGWSGILCSGGSFVFSYCKDTQKNPQTTASSTALELVSSGIDIWNAEYSFRSDDLLCDLCASSMSIPPDPRVAASKHFDARHTTTYHSTLGRVDRYVTDMVGSSYMAAGCCWMLLWVCICMCLVCCMDGVQQCLVEYNKTAVIYIWLSIPKVATHMSRYPDYLSPNITKAPKSRARREPSGVFSLFQAPQIQQFKEAFQLIDHDKDGWVNEPDLKEIFTSLGIAPSKQMIDDLLSARPGGPSRNTSEDTPAERGINFTMFLTMMSERLFEFDTETELLEAFESFDENDTGMVKTEEMRKWLGEVGERMEPGEIDKLLKGSFTDRQGNFDYREWVKVLRVNES